MTGGGERGLQLRHLGKAYAQRVLDDVELSVSAGEVHALVGVNGAGKSTLGKIVAGLVLPDSGSMQLDGGPYAPRSKRAAERAGVNIVQQELNLIPTLSIAENLLLSDLPRRWGMIRVGRLERIARTALHAVGLEHLDPGLPVGNLGIGEQQLIEIAAAIHRECRLLILDEPTAALTDSQAACLFEQVRRMTAQGVGVLYISHRMQEIRRIANRISVLRDGRLIATRSASDLTAEETVRLMTGESPRAVAPPPEVDSGQRPALRVEKLCRGARVKNVSLQVGRGEIVGLAGLVGAGRTELLRAIFGAELAESGSVQVAAGAPTRFRSPADAVRSGLALVPEDRRDLGLLLPLGVAENLTLASLSRVSRAAFLNDALEQQLAAEACRQTHTRYEHLRQPVGQLSGGNQQKVLLARWLLRDPLVYLLDEPTRGVDVAAQHAIHQLLKQLAARGRAVLMVSSDFHELIALCHRILVLRDGAVVDQFPREQFDEQQLVAAAMGHQRPRENREGV